MELVPRRPASHVPSSSHTSPSIILSPYVRHTSSSLPVPTSRLSPSLVQPPISPGISLLQHGATSPHRHHRHSFNSPIPHPHSTASPHSSRLSLAAPPLSPGCNHVTTSPHSSHFRLPLAPPLSPGRSPLEHSTTSPYHSHFRLPQAPPIQPPINPVVSDRSTPTSSRQTQSSPSISHSPPGDTATATTGPDNHAPPTLPIPEIGERTPRRQDSMGAGDTVIARWITDKRWYVASVKNVSKTGR